MVRITASSSFTSPEEPQLSRLDVRLVVVTGGAGDGIGRGISSEVVKAGQSS